MIGPRPCAYACAYAYALVKTRLQGLVLFDTPWVFDSKSCTYLTVSKTMKNKDKETLKNKKRLVTRQMCLVVLKSLLQI